MKENKKENIDTSPVEETKDKTPNVLWAKILVYILVAFLGLLSLYKVALNSVDTTEVFEESVETIYSDFTTLLSNIETDWLYNIYKENKIKINSDTKATLSDLKEENVELENYLNSLSYLSTILIDRDSRYLSFELIGNQNEQEKIDFLYLNKNFDRGIKSSLFEDKSLRVSNPNMSLIMFDTEKTKHLLDIIKEHATNSLAGKKITKEEAITIINAKPKEANKYTITITNAELSAFIDSLYETIQIDSKAFYYTADILGINSGELANYINKIKENLEISETENYELSVYTDIETKVPEKIEFAFTNQNSEQVALSYSTIEDYKTIEYKKGSKIKSLTIKGDIKGESTLTILNGKRYDISIKNNKDEKTGTIKLVELNTGNELAACDYTISMKNQSTGTYSLSILNSITLYDGEIEEHISLNTSSQVKIGEQVQKTSLDNITEMSAYLKQKGMTIKEVIIDSLKKDANIDTSKNPIQEPSPTTNDNNVTDTPISIE